MNSKLCRDLVLCQKNQILQAFEHRKALLSFRQFGGRCFAVKFEVKYRIFILKCPDLHKDTVKHNFS